MANVKISDLGTQVAGGLAASDRFEVYDASAATTEAYCTPGDIATWVCSNPATMATVTFADAANIVVNATTGTKIGTATSQKLAFYNSTPIVQPTTGVAEAAFVENAGGAAVNVDSTFGGYTVQQVVKALQNLGLLA